MARISELHYSNAFARSSGISEFLEVALTPAEAADPGQFSVGFYQHTGVEGFTVALDHPDVQVSFDADANEWVYVISADNFPILLTDPDGGGANNYEAYALVNTDTSTVIDFYDIGGGTQNITAEPGSLAAGAVSTNLPTPTDPGNSTYSLQFNQPNPDTLVYEPISEGGSGTVCFVAGTRLATPRGLVAVEALRPGDMVHTLDHGPQPVRWVGVSTIAADEALAPVEFRPGALGNEAPLRVSPQHRMLVADARAELLFGEREVLVAAVHLVDGRRVVRCPPGTVSYCHVMFDAHEIVWAEGLRSESFYLSRQSLALAPPAMKAELIALFGDRLRAGSGGLLARPELRAYEARALAPA